MNFPAARFGPPFLFPFTPHQKEHHENRKTFPKSVALSQELQASPFSPNKTGEVQPDLSSGSSPQINSPSRSSRGQLPGNSVTRRAVIYEHIH
jgi:hypothetical protein